MAYLIPHNGLSCQQKDHDCEEWRQKYIAQCTRLEAAEKMTAAIECHDLWADYKLWIPKLVEAYHEWLKKAGK